MSMEYSSSRGSLAGQVAVVTGAAGGIGAAIATALCEAGAKVVVNDVNAQRAMQMADGLGSDNAIAIAGDAGRAEDVANMIQAVQSRWQRLDILVNNVGVARDKALRKLTDEDWDEVLRINLRSAFLCTRAATALMAQQGGGRVINIASRALLGWWGQSNYAASKGGLVSFTRSLALELSRSKITCNTIAPGLIDTPLLRSYPVETQEKLRLAQPSRTIGSPADVARVAVHLASAAARNINGQLLFVDGGKSLFARPAA